MIVRIEISNIGTIFFYDENNKISRTNGPAIEYADGSKRWYFNGKRHCSDGPAIELVDGYKAWYIMGKKYSEEEFNKIVGGLC